MHLRSLAPLGACLVLFAGCGRNAPDKATPASPSSAQIFRVGNGDEPQDLDPQAITGVPEYRIVMALFEPLVDFDPKDLHPVPAIAETWDVSPDHRQYTFHIRPAAKWSNGDAITADDLLESYKRVLSANLASEYAYQIYDFVVGAKDYYDGKTKDFSQVGFKALDARTLQISLINPTPYFLSMIVAGGWIPVPVKVVAKYGAIDQKRTGWTKPGNLVGSGPFILKEWLPNQKVVVKRNPNYWDAASVKLDEIEFYPIQEPGTEERMFRTGQLDMTNTLPSEKIDTYRKDYPDALRLEPMICVYFYRFNVAKPPFNDVRVRKALALAIDREGIVKNILRGGQRPAYALSYPDDAGYTAKAQLKGGVEEAKRLLAEAGYPGGKGIPPIELLYNTQTTHREIAEAIQANWRQSLGVEISLVNQEWKVFLDSTQHKNYQLSRGSWLGDYPDPNTFLELWVKDGGNNYTNWSNPEYDRIYKEALIAPNDKVRFDLYQKLDAILVDEVPIIPIYYYNTMKALSPRVKGYYPTLLDYHPYKYIYLQN